MIWRGVFGEGLCLMGSLKMICCDGNWDVMAVCWGSCFLVT